MHSVNNELVKAGHDFAKAISNDTPFIEIAKMVSRLAAQLDVTTLALREKSYEVTAYEATVTNLTAQVQWLAADNADLMTAAKQVIKMNRQHARDKHGNPDIAESWACVKVLRRARAKANTDAALAEIRNEARADVVNAFEQHILAVGLSDDDVVSVRECKDALLHVIEQLEEKGK